MQGRCVYISCYPFGNSAESCSQRPDMADKRERISDSVNSYSFIAHYRAMTVYSSGATDCKNLNPWIYSDLRSFTSLRKGNIIIPGWWCQVDSICSNQAERCVTASLKLRSWTKDLRNKIGIEINDRYFLQIGRSRFLMYLLHWEFQGQRFHGMNCS